VSWLDALILFGEGLLAGVINAMAGGGSLLMIPLLVLSRCKSKPGAAPKPCPRWAKFAVFSVSSSTPELGSSCCSYSVGQVSTCCAATP
jgi:hypothetical protein